jgi:hypothetical protein
MRHLWSLIAGVVLAPIVWAVAAYGQAVTAQVSAKGAPTSFESKLLIAAAAFVGAGLLFGLIGSLRVSPVGPLIAGLGYLGSYGFAIAAPKAAHDAFDWVATVGDYKVYFLTPVTTGLIPVLGGALLMAVFSAGRWRSWPASAAAAEPVAASPAPSVTDTASIPEDEKPTEATPVGATSSWSTPYSSSDSDTTATPWGPPPSNR